MAVTEVERRDLYTGLEEVLGPTRANILMTYLSTDPGALATKADIDRRFESVDQRFEAIDRRFEEVDRRFDAVDRRFERVENAFADVNRRLDRLFLAVVTALLAMIATVWTQIVLG